MADGDRVFSATRPGTAVKTQRGAVLLRPAASGSQRTWHPTQERVADVAKLLNSVLPIHI